MPAREEAGLERVMELIKDLLKGKPISVKQFNPGIEDSILWTKRSGISLSESLILAGPPALPLNERETGIRVRDLIRLQRDEIINLFSEGPSSQFPSSFREVVLFSLAWRLINIGVTQGMSKEELRDLYLRVAKDCSLLWGERAREAFSLFSLGMEDFLKDMSDLDSLTTLVLYPLAFSTTMKCYLSRDFIAKLPKRILSKVLVLNQDYCAQLPSPKQDSLELLSMAQEINESYRELRSSIMNSMSRFIYAKPKVDQRIRDVLDQLSRELSDWSLRRKFELKGARLRRKLVSFLAFYPSAPDAWFDQQERLGMVRLEESQGVSAIPWPFRERGIAYLTLGLEGKKAS